MTYKDALSIHFVLDMQLDRALEKDDAYDRRLERVLEQQRNNCASRESETSVFSLTVRTISNQK